jgi:hypothetical protein
MFALCLSHHCVLDITSFLIFTEAHSSVYLESLSRLFSNAGIVKTLGAHEDGLNAFAL